MCSRQEVRVREVREAQTWPNQEVQMQEAQMYSRQEVREVQTWPNQEMQMQEAQMCSRWEMQEVYWRWEVQMCWSTATAGHCPSVASRRSDDLLWVLGDYKTAHSIDIFDHDKSGSTVCGEGSWWERWTKSQATGHMHTACGEVHLHEAARCLY